MTITKFCLLKYAIFSFAWLAAVVGLWAIFVRGKASKLVKAIVIIASAKLGALFYATTIEPNWIAVERVEIKDPALAELLGGLKIVQISDLHIRPSLRFRERQLIDKIHALQPDILLITGDILENLGELEAARELLQCFKAKIGIFGVPGNTDHYRFNMDFLVKEFAQSGLIMLRNENKPVKLSNGKVLWLAGADDPATDRDDLAKTLQGIPAGVPIILMAHAPFIYSKTVLANINLVLVGHTHGGQVGIPFLVRLSPYANRSIHMRGLVHDGKTTMYVNRGIGTKTLPIRFLCRPEIAVFEFTGRGSEL